jgi:magnesium chelatase family protein
MLARALASIMPPLNFTESIEVSQIYSILGKLNRELPMIVNRPFRQIHHTASKIAIV